MTSSSSNGNQKGDMRPVEKNLRHFSNPGKKGARSRCKEGVALCLIRWVLKAASFEEGGNDNVLTEKRKEL